MAIPRLFVDQPFVAGAALALSEAQGRYLATVLRLGPGAPLQVFNGRDGEWEATVARASKREVVLALEAPRRPQATPPDILLLFSPVKRHGTDIIVEKATELGVRTLQPVLLRRTTAETVRTDRLRAIAIEAAEQTGRLDIPEVREAAPLARVLDRWDGRSVLFADEAGDAAPLSEVAASSGGERIALLTGPEGGFDPEERRVLLALAYVRPVSLGPRILRAETAVIAALALIQAHWGDWKVG